MAALLPFSMARIADKAFIKQGVKVNVLQDLTRVLTSFEKLYIGRVLRPQGHSNLVY
jgi:hypothetical protein